MPEKTPLTKWTRPTLLVLAAAAFLFPLDGCGGGSGGVGGGTTPSLTIAKASGVVSLPAGFKESITSLKVVSGVDSQPVSANGAFSLNVVGPGETLVSLEDASGQTVLFGYADAGATGSPEAGGHGVVSASSTAETLLFYSLDGFFAPPTNWTQLLGFIRQTSQFSQLTSTVASRVAALPTAVGSGDPQIFNAAASAATTLSNAATASARPQFFASQLSQKAPQFSTTVSVVAKPSDGGDDTQILVQPTGEDISGLEILNNPDGDGIIVVNHFRRRCVAYIYATATQVSGGNLTTITPEPLTDLSQGSLMGAIGNTLGLDTGGNDVLEVAATNAPNGLFGSISDVLFNNGAYTPTGTTPVILPLKSGTIRTDYTIVVLGPSLKNTLSSFPPALIAGFNSEVPKWQHALTVLDWETAIIDVALPLLSSVPLPGSPKWQQVNNLGIEDIVGQLSAIPDFVETVETGDVKGIVEALIANLSSSSTLRNIIFQAVWTQTFGAGTFAEQFSLANGELERKFAVLDAVNLVLTAADKVVVASDIETANAGEVWTGNVVVKTVHLSPTTATVNATNPSVLLTASPGATTDPMAPFIYEYKVSGSGGGSLENAVGTSGRLTSLTTIQNQVQYLVNINAENGQKDTVTLTEFQNKGTAANPVEGIELGTTASVITVDLPTEGPCGAVPTNLTIGGDAPTITVSPTVVSPGDTVTVTIKIPSNTVGSINFGQNGTVLVDAITSNSGLNGQNMTFQNPVDGINFNLSGTDQSSVTVTVKIDKNTPLQCPTKGSGNTLAALGGVWVTGSASGVGLNASGSMAVPLEIVAKDTGSAAPKK